MVKPASPQSMVYFDSDPLPFDELPTSYLPTYRPLSLVERLEVYEDKDFLMSFYRLNWAGVDYPKVRHYINLFKGQYNGGVWRLWKDAICEATGKSWDECAQQIYGDLFQD